MWVYRGINFFLFVVFFLGFSKLLLVILGKILKGKIRKVVCKF